MGAVPGQYRLVRGCKGSLGVKLYGGGTCKTLRGRYGQNGMGHWAKRYGAVHAKRYGALGKTVRGRYGKNGMGHWAKRYGGGTGKTVRGHYGQNGTGAVRAKRYEDGRGW